MRSGMFLFVAGLLLAIIIPWAFSAVGCGTLPGLAAPLRGKIGSWNERLVARGILVPAKETKVNAQVLTQVKFLVEDGKQVEKGDIVCELVMTRTEERLRKIRDLYQTSAINLRKQETLGSFSRRLFGYKLEQHLIEFERKTEEEGQARDSREWDRIVEEEENRNVQVLERSLARKRLEAQQALGARGLGAKSQLLAETKERHLVELSSDLTRRLLPWLEQRIDWKRLFPASQARDNASAALALIRICCDVDVENWAQAVRSAQANLRDAQEQVSTLEAELASGVIRAPVAGVCLRQKTFSGAGLEKIVEGDRVFPGIAFLSIIDPDRFMIEFLLCQRDVGGVKTGRRILFRPDSMFDRQFEGEIVEISVTAQEAVVQDPGGERNFKVRARLPGVPVGLLPGAGGTVEVLGTGSAPRALLIDRGCLEPAPTAAGWKARAGWAALPEDWKLLGWNDLEVAFALPESSSNFPSSVSEQPLPWHRIVKTPMRRIVSLPGEIRSRQRSLVAPFFAGRLAKLLEDGTRVKQGEVVAAIETNELDREGAELEIQIKTKSEQLDLLEGKNEIELERFKRKVVIAGGALEVARLEHQTLLKRRDEDEIIRLEKSRDLIRSKIKTLAEQRKLESDLARRGLKSEIELLATDLEIARQEREAAITANKLDFAVSGPTRRQIRLSELNVRLKDMELKMARHEMEQFEFSREIEEELLAAELRSLQFNREIGQKKIASASIVSHQDGIIIQPEVWKSGQISKVKIGDQVHRDVPFMHVANPDQLEIKLDVPEIDAPFFTVGKPVEITMKSAPGKTFTGKVERLGRLVDQETRGGLEGTVEMFVGLTETTLDPAFRPGGTCEATLKAYDMSEALVVPVNGFLPAASGPVVMDEDGREHPFSPLFVDGLAGAVVASGLVEGQKIRLGLSERSRP